MIKKIISIISALAVLWTVVSVSAEEWIRVPLVTEQMLDRGMVGGEGCQWLQALAISRSNPDFLMMGSDVSGVYRSNNGGALWEHSNRGYIARGAAGGLVIDPFNEKHILSVGSNSTVYDSNGIYLSLDGAESWELTHQASICGYRDFRDQIAFDPSSLDAKNGICMVAYWSRADYDNGHKVEPALYKTEDGGRTWHILDNSEQYGGMVVAVHEKTGDVYLAGRTGFYKSTDGGVSFSKKLDGVFTSMDTIYTKPNEVYLTTWNKVYKSEDGGESFSPLQITQPPEVIWQEPEADDNFMYEGWCEIKVSPADTNRMMMCAGMGWYNWFKWYSADGGKTWNKSVTDNTFSIMPYNNRQPQIVFHPTNPDIIYSFGGDWITKSDDGGKTFRYSNDGNNSVAAGIPNFNIYDSNLWFMPVTDYNSAVSTNGGITWEYGLLENHDWGGQGRGGYMVSEDYILGVTYGVDGDLCLYESKSAPENGVWSFEKRFIDNPDTKNEMRLTSHYVYQSPKDPNTLFAGQYISRDCGKTWNEMNGCKGVITHNWNTDGKGELFGISGEGRNEIVYSEDNGATWKSYAGIEPSIDDIAYDYKNKVLYATGGLYLYKISTNPDGVKIEEINNLINSNTRNWQRVRSVAIDPRNPDIVYIAGSGDIFANDAAVQRSCDGGKTWETLVRNTIGSVTDEGLCGGVEGTAVRVHPKTGYAYVATSCYGLWKIGPPGTDEEHLKPLAAVAKNSYVEINWFGNGQMNVADLANMAYNSQYNNKWDNATVCAFDRNGDRTVNEDDLDILGQWIMKEWDVEKDEYELYKSTDGTCFERILSSTQMTEYKDFDVEVGAEYWYKVKNMKNGEFTQTAHIIMK